MNNRLIAVFLFLMIALTCACGTIKGNVQTKKMDIVPSNGVEYLDKGGF